MRAKRAPIKRLLTRLVLVLLLTAGIQSGQGLVIESANAAATLISDDGSNSTGWTTDGYSDVNYPAVSLTAGNPGQAFAFHKNTSISHSFGTSGADFSGAKIKFHVRFTSGIDQFGIFWGTGSAGGSGKTNSLWIGTGQNPASGDRLSGHGGITADVPSPNSYWHGIDGGISGTGNASDTWQVNRWYEVELAIGQTSTSYYVDGNLIQTKATTLPTQNKVTMGLDDRNGYNFFNGVFVDNITITPAMTAEFLSNGATGTMANQVSSGSGNLSSNTYTKSGSTFVGWNTSADGTGLFYANSATYDFASNISLYAQWSSDSVPVNFNTDGGSSVAASSVAIGSAIPNAPTAPTKSGYTFGGWKATAGGSAITFPYYPILSTGYANSVSSAALVDLGRYENKGTWASSTWYGPNRSTPWSTKDFVTYTDGRKYIAIRESNNSVLSSPTRLDGYYLVPLDSSTTLTAIWTQNNFNVTFDSKNGVASTIRSVNQGSMATAPTDPTWYGYNFKGWSETSNGSPIDVATIAISGTKTFHAIWEQKSLVGINTAQLVNPTVITPNGTDQTLISTRAASGNVARTRTIINYYDGALPSSYDISVYTLPDNTFATEQLGSDKSYIISQVVAWKDRVNGNVTDTVVRKEIEMTIESTEIKSGAKVYSIVDGVSTLLATATQNGSVTVSFSKDPVIVVQAAPIVPSSPTPSGGGGSTSSESPAPSPLPVITVAKSFNILGFNPGSWALTKNIKNAIDTFFKSLTKPSKITCVGYTTGPTVLSGDARLAIRRGQEVCSYIGLKNPSIAHVITKGTTTRISSDYYRRTKVTVSN